MIVSPIAARMAAENGIDLKSITGSGPNGRIIKRDIEAAIAEGQSPKAKSTSRKPRRVLRNPDVQGASAFREENTSKMRQVIAQRLANQSDRFRHFI